MTPQEEKMHAVQHGSFHACFVMSEEKMHAVQHGSFHACFVMSRTILACRQCRRLCDGQRLLVSPFQATITWRVTLCIRLPIGNGVMMAPWWQRAMDTDHFVETPSPSWHLWVLSSILASNVQHLAP